MQTISAEPTRRHKSRTRFDKVRSLLTVADATVSVSRLCHVSIVGPPALKLNQIYGVRSQLLKTGVITNYFSAVPGRVVGVIAMLRQLTIASRLHTIRSSKSTKTLFLPGLLGLE